MRGGVFKRFPEGFAAFKPRATAGTAPGDLRSELGFCEDGRRASKGPSEDPGVPEPDMGSARPSAATLETMGMRSLGESISAALS